MFTKLKNFHNKNTDSSNKINDKIDALETKLTELSHDISAISRKQPEINFSSPASLASTTTTTPPPYSSLFDKPLNTINNISDSPNLEGNTSSWNRNLKDPEISNTTSDSGDSDSANHYKIQSSLSQSPSPASTSSPSSLSTTPLQSSSSFDKADDNAPADMSTNIDKSERKVDLDHDNEFSSSTSSSHNLHPQERNSNPELDSIEEEILTALKRLGRTDANTDLTKETDESSSNSNPEKSDGKTNNEKK